MFSSTIWIKITILKSLCMSVWIKCINQYIVNKQIIIVIFIMFTYE